MINEQESVEPDTAMLKIPAFLRRKKAMTDTKEAKPRTAAQKWARIEKIRAKIKDMQAEESRLTEELKSTLA